MSGAETTHATASPSTEPRRAAFTPDPDPFDDDNWAARVSALLGVTLAEIRALDVLHAVAQSLPQDDLATAAMLEEAHFDPAADEPIAVEPDPLGSWWRSWREGCA